jgi:hypothetical protein
LWPSTRGLQKGVPVVIVSSARRALPLLPRFRTYRCVAPLGDQSADPRRGAAHGGQLCQAAELSGRPLNHYDALGITVAGLGEVQDQARRPCGERAKVGHSLCDHRDVASNLDLHVWGVAVEACSHLGDVIGCVSHSRLQRDGIKEGSRVDRSGNVEYGDDPRSPLMRLVGRRRPAPAL